MKVRELIERLRSLPDYYDVILDTSYAPVRDYRLTPQAIHIDHTLGEVQFITDDIVPLELDVCGDDDDDAPETRPL